MNVNTEEAGIKLKRTLGVEKHGEIQRNLGKSITLTNKGKWAYTLFIRMKIVRDAGLQLREQRVAAFSRMFPDSSVGSSNGLLIRRSVVRAHVREPTRMRIEWFMWLPSLTCAASGNSSTVLSRVGVAKAAGMETTRIAPSGCHAPTTYKKIFFAPRGDRC